MLIHFINEYSILGRIGDRLRIQGMFPGIQVNDFIYLSDDSMETDISTKYRIEKIEYGDISGNNYFGAEIIAE